MSDHFQGELRFLGIARSSPSYRKPHLEGNGCVRVASSALLKSAAALGLETFPETVEQLAPRAARVPEDRYNEALSSSSACGRPY